MKPTVRIRIADFPMIGRGYNIAALGPCLRARIEAAGGKDIVAELDFGGVKSLTVSECDAILRAYAELIREYSLMPMAGTMSQGVFERMSARCNIVFGKSFT